MLGRVIAVVLLLVGIVGIGIAIAGVLFGFQVVDALSESLDETLALTSESLDTVNDTLLLTQQTMAQTGQAIGTVADTTDSVAQTLADTQPLLDEVSRVTTVDVPDSLDAVQGAVPNLVAVAGAVDNTLETLSRFDFQRTVFGVPIGFDLGIDYDPEAPFDESVAQIGSSLEEVPDNLRGLQVHLDTANDNLAAISDKDHPVAGQLIGNSPEVMDAAAVELVKMGFDVIDLGAASGNQPDLADVSSIDFSFEDLDSSTSTTREMPGKDLDDVDFNESETDFITDPDDVGGGTAEMPTIEQEFDHFDKTAEVKALSEAANDIDDDNAGRPGNR